MINKKNIKNLILDDINDYLVLFEDSSSIYNIETEFFNQYRFFSQEASDFIDKNFKIKQNKNNKITDTIIYGLITFETYNNRIFIGFEKGNYKTYLATREADYKDFIAKNNFFIIPIIVNSLIVTADNKIIILKTKDYEELIGGFIGEEDVINDNIDFIKFINKTTKNIVGDIQLFNTKIIGVYKANYSCIFVFNHYTKFTSEEILNNFNKLKHDNSESIDFVINVDDNLGKIICNGYYSKHVRQAFKFFLKENCNNYKYMNVKLI